MKINLFPEYELRITYWNEYGTECVQKDTIYSEGYNKREFLEYLREEIISDFNEYPENESITIKDPEGKIAYYEDHDTISGYLRF